MELKTKTYWQDKASQMVFEGRAFIDGKLVWALSQQTFSATSPLLNHPLAKVAACQKSDVDQAVMAAKSAFNSGTWRLKTPAQRKAILFKFADLVEAHGEELALLDALETGKPIRYALNGDNARAVSTLRWYAEAIDKQYDEIATTEADQLGLITQEPIGVVAAIVPWNFPTVMAAWKFAPALALGNSVILKPSEKSSLSAIKLAQLGFEAGLPASVFNVLPGLGQDVGEAIARHEGIDVLAFTGSTQTAKKLMVCAGESNMKRVYAEAGGKSANIVFDDASHLAEAAKAAASAICYNSGQVCTAGTRLLLQNNIADAFIELLREEISQWQSGHPLCPNTTLGPLVDGQQHQRVSSYIEKAKAQNIKQMVFGTEGGFEISPDAGPCAIAPIVFDHVDNRSSLAQEEIFGPVLSIIRFDTEDEAVALANDSPYGLAGAVWTQDISRAHRVAKALQAGSVWVNQYDGGDLTAPFGGYKQSGNGRDKSLHAFDKYTETKATWIKL